MAMISPNRFPRPEISEEFSSDAPQSELPEEIPSEITIDAASSLATFTHPEISEEIRPEKPFVGASPVTESQITASVDAAQSELREENTPEITINDASSPTTFTHPEISEEIRPEKPFVCASPATESQITASVDAAQSELREENTAEITINDASSPTTFSHPEISEEIRPEKPFVGASPATESQMTASVDAAQSELREENPPEITINDASSPTTFSHPEICEEIRPEKPFVGASPATESQMTASVDAAQSELREENPPEITINDASSPTTFSHPEISEENRPDEPFVGAFLATESQVVSSVDAAQPQVIAVDPTPVAFFHPEISQGIPSKDASVVAALATSTPRAFSHPEISQEIPPTEAFVTHIPAFDRDKSDEIPPTEVSVSTASGTSTPPAETSEEVARKTSVVSVVPTLEFCDPVVDEGVRPEDASATRSPLGASLAAPRVGAAISGPMLTTTYEETSSEISSKFATILRPHTAVDIAPASESTIVNTLPATLSEEVPSGAAAAPSGEVSETTGYDSEEFPKNRTEICRDDRKAIIDVLARKTLSPDAIFEPVFQGERKYVSDIAARKTITDHTKDAEAISSAEREALQDYAARKTIVKPDIKISPSDEDIPIWYTNPMTDQMTDMEKAALAAVGKSEVKIQSDVKSPDVPRSDMSEELTPQSNLRPIMSPTATSEPKEISIEERNNAVYGRAWRKVSMETIPEEGKSERKIKKTVSISAPDPSPPDEGGPKMEPVDSGFPMGSPLMPFSKKERRELVRSISMRIIEPEAPLWDMDMADIKEAEEAEKQRKPSPLPFEPTFDFEDPIKPKERVRRSKRHRMVRVHATDYARAQAVESLEFCTNKIKSTKYTLMTFIPINLFVQCSKAANLYFLLIAALQLIPGFSPTNWSTTVAPLCFVLFLNALKDAIDEIKRSISDRTINKQKVEVLNENTFVETNWSSVIVGDIVRVKSEKEFPADLVFLSSADVKGLAYVETANLDGETNLKIRNAFYKGSSTGEDDETPYSIFSGLTIECELPNNRLYKFEGAINLQDYGKLPLDTRQILLRGATLRNTEWILGVVVYTGADTKFIRNMIPGQVKVTQLERNLNILVAIVFVFQVSLCVGLAAANDEWTRDDSNFSFYVPDFAYAVGVVGPKPNTIGAQFGRFLILLNQLIPISLYVSLELVKVVQSYYIDWDVHMYHRASKTHAKARTTNLNEELGQVEYVMADKTGTLTQNIMAFVQCSIGGVIYGTIQHEGGFKAGQTKDMKDTIHTLANDPKLIKKLKEVAAGSQDTDSKFLAAFFNHLAICHVVHPVFAKKGEEGIAEDAVLKYTGASPDEEALVQGAADCGYELKKRADDELSVHIPGLGLQKFVIMAVLEFTSERKRMSIICRDSKGRIKLYCKGADSVIFKRLARGQEELVETSLNQLEDFARGGYRTLCMAERQISGTEYEKWAARFRDASIALDDRDEKLAAVSETIERDLMLLGVTAVEDKLQGKVPETITLLAQAGIKVWVLTGDKLETSVSVALSCNLLADSMHLFLLSENVSKSVPQLLRSMLDEARRQHHSKLRMEGSEYQSEMATVIEGSSLTVALENNNKLLFLELLKLCRSVVCCRVSPIQKAQITLLLKEHGNSVILAIGDGANDCGMIKAAQIGVGIGGREGMAAVLASDYAITRFRYLRRLLLVHGRWSYKRNRELVMYAFYKNIVYSLGNCYLAFYSGFSSQALYSTFEIATFNLIWTCFPTLALSVLNKDLSDCTAENNPQLYAESQLEKRPAFFWCLTGWALAAFWDSLIAFFLPLAVAFASGKSGETIGIREFGSTVYTVAIFIVNVKIFSRMHNLTWFHCAAFSISICLWLLVFFCLSFSWRLSGFFPDLVGVGEVVTQSSCFWLLLLLCPVVAILPYCTFEIFRNQQVPEDFEVMREIEHGWTDGYFFPDAPDYVEQITAPIPERRTSVEFPEVDDYGPSPMQKEIADATHAIPIEGGGLSKPSETPGSTESTEHAGGPVMIQPAKGKMDDKQLRPRRLTWREVVNDDELEDLATSEALGRDGRRRSSGFQVVTRHNDSAEAPVVPLAQGPAPTQRKSVMFEQGAPLVSAPTTVAARRASLKPPGMPPTVKEEPREEQKQQETKPKTPPPPPPKRKKPEDSRLKDLRAKLAKHDEERKTLIPGPGTSSPKRTTKKGQNIWAAVKEGSAERDPYARRDSSHPLQKMQPPGSSSRSTTTTPRASSARSPRAGSPGPHPPQGTSKPGTHGPSRFNPTTKPQLSGTHTPRAGGTGHSPRTSKPPKFPEHTPGPKQKGDSKDPKTGTDPSRLST